MKRLQSLSYKTLFTILFLSLAGIVFFIRIGGKTQKVSAAWWDEMWHYRKAIQINNSGTNRTNIQFKLFTNYDLSSLVSAGKIQADLDDLRFTDINGNLLNYWIEDPTNNSADIWIVLNSLPNSGTTVYLYYGNSSATSGQTIMGKTPNNPGISCKAIQLSGGSDGVYYIDPTGLEATDAYQTYCDMSGNGGGWTLLMKSEGNTTTFNYNANYWTTTNTLNPNDADINQNTDAKFESFNSLLIDQIRATWPSTGHTMVETISTTTALGLFQTTVDLGPSMAQFDYTNFPYQTGYQSYGFNLTCAAAKKVRWGWMFNNETTCSSNDCSAGIGLMTVYSTTNGGYVTCCSSLAVGGYPYRVRIWGRENNIVTPDISFINTNPQSEESSGGPIAYWKFDEGVGTTVYDSAGTSNGTFTGTTFPEWQNEENCISGKCLKIQKTNSYVNTINQLSLSEITVSVWVKITSFNTLWQNIILHRGNAEGGSGFYIRAWEGGSVQWLVGNNSGGYIGINSGSLTPNQWHHVVGTAKIGEPIKLYIDNKLYSGATISSLNLGNTSDITFGRSDYAINGSIDEFKIYPYARTADQIKQDYNSRGSTSGAGVNLGVRSNTAPSLKSSLIAHYKFDEGSGTIAYNSGKAIGSNGTLLNSPVWTVGKISKGLEFINSGSQPVQPVQILGTGELENLTDSSYAFSAWIKPLNNNIHQYAVTRVGYHTGIYYGTNQKFGFSLWNNIPTYYSVSSTHTYPPNNWYHVVGLVDDTNKIVKIYINGKLDGITSYSGTLRDYVTDYYVIGSAVSSGSCSESVRYCFSGVIDEVKFYNYALTEEEIKQDYNAGSAIQFGSTTQSIGGTTTSLEYCIPGDTSYCAPPISEWKMDEGVGTSIVDTSGNNNTGTLVNSPIWVQGKIGKALQLNGSNQRSNVGNNINPSLITAEVWLYRTSSAINQGIIRKQNAYAISLKDNTVQVAPGNNWSFYNTAQTIPLNTWTHLTWTYDGSYMKLYINGSLAWTSALLSGTFPSNSSTTWIGYDDNNWWWGGKIDHFKIYNYARTPAQIAYDYNKGGPIGWWKFDECQGNTAYDWSGNQNNGTITVGASGSQNSLGTCAVGTSAAWTNGATGKTNSSLNFDGVDDKVALNPITNYLSGSFSYSAWIKLDTNVGAAVKNAISSEVSSYSNYWSVIGTYLNKWNFALYEGSNNPIAFSNDNFELNTWTHIVGVRDITTDKIYIYKNGVLQGNGTTDTTTSIPAYSAFNIGGQVNVANRYFPGQIDDVRIYNYALTEEQIKQIYNGGAVNFR